MCYVKSPQSKSLVAHTLLHIHGCGGKITHFTVGQTTKAAYFLSGSFRFSMVSVSLIDDPFYRLITVYISPPPSPIIENLPTTARGGCVLCVCQPDATPSPSQSQSFGWYMLQMYKWITRQRTERRKERTHDSCHVILRRGFRGVSYRSTPKNIFAMWSACSRVLHYRIAFSQE